MTDPKTPPQEPEQQPASPEELAQAAKHRVWLIAILAVFIITPLVLASLRLLGII
ncbi:MAG: hypothetical protein JJU20_11375 [Opitutales bacterium]|nr:hypothetical protein [Opitutales bacterium]